MLEKDVEMVLRRLVEEAGKTYGENLRSAILFGSAVRGDYVPRRSDVNVLFVLGRLGMDELSAAHRLARGWMRRGNPPPLLLSEEALRASADVFPMEFLDIREHRRVLAGADPFRDLAVSPVHLRHQCEHELRGAILRLRQQYIRTGGRPRALAELLLRSASTFVNILRGVVRLRGEVPPADPRALARALGSRLGVDPAAFLAVLDGRAGRRAIPSAQAADLFRGCWQFFERVAERVDRMAAGKGESSRKETV